MKGLLEFLEVSTKIHYLGTTSPDYQWNCLYCGAVDNQVLDGFSTSQLNTNDHDLTGPAHSQSNQQTYQTY
jgi:hypothetical protein